MVVAVILLTSKDGKAVHLMTAPDGSDAFLEIVLITTDDAEVVNGINDAVTGVNG